MMKTIVSLVLALPLVTATGTINCTNAVVDFNVLDPSVDPYIVTALSPEVDLLDFPTCALNIEAVVESTPSNCDEGTVKCVKFFLDDVFINKEKFTPFTLYKDTSLGDISARKPPIGPTTLKACTYTSKDCTKGEAGCKTVDINFLDCDRPTPSPTLAPTLPPTLEPTLPPTPEPTEAPIPCDSGNEIIGFELVDAEFPKNPIITPFTPPMINLLDFPTCELNIFAIGKNNTCGAPPIACVKLSLGSQVRRERFVPYALFGDATGKVVYDRKPDLGANTLEACTYTDIQCKTGKAGCLTVDVLVTDCIDMSMPM